MACFAELWKPGAAVVAGSLRGFLVCGLGLGVALMASPVRAVEIGPTPECAVGGTIVPITSPLYGKWVAGWNHNRDPLTGNADLYSRPNDGNDQTPNKSNWSEIAGFDTSVVASAAPEFPAVPTPAVLDNPPAVSAPPAATGLTRYWEGRERSRYLYGGVGDPNLSTAVANDRYMQYQFTTASGLAPGTFLRKLYLLTYSNSAFKYTVRASTDPNFGSYWTLAQDVQVTAANDNDSNNWQRRPQINTGRFPVLAAGQTYYLRIYIYAATVSAVVATNSPAPKYMPPNGTMVVVADDFMFGTAVCPPPTVTVSKQSNTRTGTFTFSGDNGVANHDITTATAGTAVAGATQTLTAGYTATTITEANAPASRFKLASVSCTVPAGGAYTTTPATLPITGSGGGSVTLDPRATQWGTTSTCTFTNAPADVDLSVTKTNAQTTAASGSQTTYTLRVENRTGPGPADGAMLQDTPAANLSGCVVVPGSCTATNGATCPANLAGILPPGTGAPIPSLPATGAVEVKVQCNVD